VLDWTAPTGFLSLVKMQGDLTVRRSSTFRADAWETAGSFEKSVARDARLVPGRLAVDVLSPAEAKRCGRWVRTLASRRKDRRYYEILEDTITENFDYRYFAIRDGGGAVRALVPFFITDTDLLTGVPYGRGLVERVRRLWPRFMQVRTLMVGCVAGEGYLDDEDELAAAEQARSLSRTIAAHARALGAALVVFKEFPARYRGDLACLKDAGFTRAPSMPMVALGIDYPDFKTFMSRVLSYKTRKDLNVKFRRAEAAGPLEMTVVRDITPFVDDVYPLYLQVYDRAELHFEKLTPEYLCRLGREMPDKTVFFIWRHQGRTVAFSMCMLENDDMYGEYLGFDYTVALDLHLYHLVIRDVITWAMAHGYKTLRSSEGGYDPKRHLRFELAPVDLYVRAGSRAVNFMLSKLLPYMVPVSYDPVLRRFPNYDKVWND
jgi:hypothetical protein